MVPTTKAKEPVVVAIEPSQTFQPLVELVHIENPQFFITQPILVYEHSIENWR